MRVEQSRWTPSGGWDREVGALGDDARLVLAFGSTALLQSPTGLEAVRAAWPSATVMGCSTAGEISGTEVTDDTLVATAMAFRETRVKTVAMAIGGPEESASVGQRIGLGLPADGLRHVFVLTDGLKVNGSELVRGLTSALPESVVVTGGLSGDGARFEETLVVCDGEARSGWVAAAGLYGDALRIGYGSLGGWDPFGPTRRITRSRGNVLFALDGTSALQLYKRYLGDHARDLPSSGLLFPLALRAAPGDVPVVRTILAVDEDEQSLTFAGDVPEGATAQLMKANFDRLVDGAIGAAQTSRTLTPDPELAILISCVGRKLVLKQRVEEEVEGVREVLGGRTVLSGFYSYGEISPFSPGARCELHNQTMTITTLSEE